MHKLAIEDQKLITKMRSIFPVYKHEHEFI
jgi:hypothetical protein